MKGLLFLKPSLTLYRCPCTVRAPPPPDVLICSCAHPHPPHTHPPRTALSAPSHTPAPSHALADHPPQGSHELPASTSSAPAVTPAPAAHTPPCPLVHPTRRVACHRRSPRALIARARTAQKIRSSPRRSSETAGLYFLSKHFKLYCQLAKRK